MNFVLMNSTNFQVFRNLRPLDDSSDSSVRLMQFCWVWWYLTDSINLMQLITHFAVICSGEEQNVCLIFANLFHIVFVCKEILSQRLVSKPLCCCHVNTILPLFIADGVDFISLLLPLTGRIRDLIGLLPVILHHCHCGTSLKRELLLVFVIAECTVCISNCLHGWMKNNFVMCCIFIVLWSSETLKVQPRQYSLIFI